MFETESERRHCSRILGTLKLAASLGRRPSPSSYLSSIWKSAQSATVSAWKIQHTGVRTLRIASTRRGCWTSGLVDLGGTEVFDGEGLIGERGFVRSAFPGGKTLVDLFGGGETFYDGPS